MAVMALQIVGLVMGFLGLILQIASTCSNTWRVSSNADSVISATWVFEGLWMNCAASALGSVQCKWFRGLLGLDSYVQGCRALMIVSLLLGLAGVIVALLGLKCTKIGSGNEQTKGKIALTGGVCLIASGLCCIIPVSWYAYQITQEFYNPIYGGTKYELGPALYMGWGGAILAILGGAFLCCSCTGGQKGYKYAGPGQRNQQNIYKASSAGETKAYV
ncbi:claudin 15-like b isoform X1 [Acipenser ruthenus]|uniref:claudin 15-like b isoform X1 n=1 Tax=Acipenser ruthenus TaxID=7906 RepID=UPI00274209AD|nr:claudin 15-like b isoform X1 [Acipenser ruthenus]